MPASAKKLRKLKNLRNLLRKKGKKHQRLPKSYTRHNKSKNKDVKT
jgi:hypothetical protein